MRLLLVLCFISSTLIAASGQNSPQTEFKKIILKSGTTLENVTVYREDTAFITFLNEDGLIRIPKTDLPDDIAKQLNFDPKLAKAQMDAEAEQARKLAAKVQSERESEAAFQKYGVELQLGSIHGVGPDGFFVNASMLGESKGTFIPSSMISGAPGLGSWKNQRSAISLGTIYLKGLSRSEIENSVKPVWACQIGSTEMKESVQTNFGYSERNGSCAVYTTNKRDVASYYAGNR